MSYKALYRTYRPSTFEEVAGQKVIVQTLQNALNQNKIAHAYLFAGPRGTGKTTMAKLFAKALNCEKGIGHQCNECSNCLAVNDGSHQDIIEIDAASNNGVDDIRALVDNVNYAPIKGRYKVYIIDEVHMMSANAFNALLKTLEEPPSHVVFILATTEPHKIIPTILSRCQRYNFSKVSDKDIKQRMIEILKIENISYEESAIDLIISLADGGVRDALSMLDQVLAYANQTLNEEDVLDLFALLNKTDKLDLLYAIKDHNVKLLMNKISHFLDKGIDVRRLSADLLGLLKDLLIFYKTKDESLMLFLTKREAKHLSANLSLSRLNELINSLLKALNDFRFVTDLRSLFELTLLQMASSGDDFTSTKIEQPVNPTSLETSSKIEPISSVEQKIQENIKPTIVKKVELEKEEELPPFLQEQESPTKKTENDNKDQNRETIPFPISANEPPPLEGPELMFAREEYLPIQEEHKRKVAQKRKVILDALVIETPKIKVGRFIKEGPSISLSDDTLIKAMTLGSRDERRNLYDNAWKKLPFMGEEDENLASFSSLLHNGTPYILTDQLLVLVYEFNEHANLCNLIDNQQSLRKIIAEFLGREVVVYAISRTHERKVTKLFTNLNQLHQLPRVKNIDKELEEIL
ncbi:MAG: DNA polymerase III subunit gamma/tau [Bacilli bacterium]|jgi:DNA polymerase-3 subunit gamma/tau|nr:DNA polymerase III subunit gamma/tau [Bacilli bacterium]